MKFFNRSTILGLFCVLHVVDVLCSQSLYEEIAPYIEDAGLVDPDSLYYNRHSQTVKSGREYSSKNLNSNEVVVGKHGHHSAYCKDSHYEVFARRVINMLISKSNMRINDGIAIGSLDLEATIEELEILREFGNGKISVREVDGVLSDVIRQSQTSLFDEAMDITEHFSMFIYKHRVIVGSSLLCMLVIIISLKVRWTRWRVIILLFDVMVIFSLMLTWWELMQEVEIKLAAQQAIYRSMPDECRQNEIGLIRSIFLFFGVGRGDCQKYFEAVMMDPVLRVTPLHAFSHMWSKFVFYPFTACGNHLVDFIETLTSPLFFPLNHIAKVALIILFPTMICTLIFVLVGGSMGLRLGPFLHVYLHGRDTQPPNSLSKNDRHAIEIIKSEIQQSLTAALNSPKALLTTQTQTESSSEKQNSSRVEKKAEKIKYEKKNQLKSTLPAQTKTPSKKEDLNQIERKVEKTNVDEENKEKNDRNFQKVFQSLITDLNQVKITLPAQTKAANKKEDLNQIEKTEEEIKNDKKNQEKEDTEERDGNSTISDEFPEEAEYEKISRTRLENEIFQSLREKKCA